MSGASFYPAPLLALPIHLQGRLPPSLQALDLQFALAVHVALAFVASVFTLHPAYLLPLSLFGLVASHPSLTSLLPHFVAFWVLSVPVDLIWLLYKGTDARLIVVTAVGAGMVLKLPSSAAAAQAASTEGYIAQDGRGTGFQGFAGVSASVPGGLWSGVGSQSRDGEYQRVRHSLEAEPSCSFLHSLFPSVLAPGAYSSIYNDDDEEAGMTQDAQHVQVGTGPPPQSAKTPSTTGHTAPGRGGYSSID